MTYAVRVTQTHETKTLETLSERLSRIVAALGMKRASQRDGARARRTALAMSEEARIHAQMRYRRMRYRHMAS